MNAEIVSTGTELLLGKSCNEDAKILCDLLARCGIDIYRYTTVGDNVGRIVQAYKEALERSDIVLSTGGLGGTGSDLSKQAASIATSIPLETDPDIYKYLMDKHVPERISRSFAAIPAGSTVFQNTSGVAPGIVIHTNGKYLILLPGPPEEIKSIIRNGLEAFLKTFGNGYTKNDVLKIVGLRESEVEDRIHDLALSSNPTISTFLKKGWIEISLTAKGKDENEAIAILEEVKKRVLERFSEKFLGKVGETLEEELYRLLKEKNLTLSVAESVTGGMISDRIVSVPGISSFFKGGVVVYSNESKVKILGVSKKTITEHGAVSKACVLEMAKGALEVFKTDIAIATTGLAGPTGETKDNPLGTVWFGLSSKFESQVWQKIYGGTRNEVRKAASDDALESLVNMIANFEVIENG
jgi:nicotinamide-nucleotide amidase